MRLPDVVLQAASLLAPGRQRAEWLREWRSELWYVPRPQATRFCLGAFRDALWLRRQHSGVSLESAGICLGLLAALAAASAMLSVSLLEILGKRWSLWRMPASSLPQGWALTLLYTGIFLPVARLLMGRSPVAAGRAGRLRRGLFLALKIALAQPVMLGAFFLLMLAGPAAPPASPLRILALPATAGIPAIWFLTMRWVLLDQRRRCPVCLRVLTNPVRIGSASQTFLEWYGAESMCERGHGLLQVPETSASYAGAQQWLKLDESWSGL